MDLLCRFRPKRSLPLPQSYRVTDFAPGNCLDPDVTRTAALVAYERVDMTRHLRKWHMHNPCLSALNIFLRRSGYC